MSNEPEAVITTIVPNWKKMMAMCGDAKWHRLKKLVEKTKEKLGKEQDRVERYRMEKKLELEVEDFHKACAATKDALKAYVKQLQEGKKSDADASSHDFVLQLAMSAFSNTRGRVKLSESVEDLRAYILTPEAGVEGTKIGTKLFFLKTNKRTGLVDRRKNTKVSDAPYVFLTKMHAKMFGGKVKPAGVLELESARAARMKVTSMREKKREREQAEKEAAFNIDVAPSESEDEESADEEDQKAAAVEKKISKEKSKKKAFGFSWFSKSGGGGKSRKGVGGDDSDSDSSDSSDSSSSDEDE